MQVTSPPLPNRKRTPTPAANRPLVAPLKAHWPLLLVTLVSLGTAFFQLGAKGLWGDEVWEVTWAHQQPLFQTFMRFRAPPDLSLQFLLVQISTAFNTSPFWVRFPSALLGAATVVLLFLLGRRILGTPAALLAALFLAIAPYHVWYSQDARPYAALACYSLLSLYFLWRLLERPSVLLTIGLAMALTLDVYDQLFAVFPILVEVIVAAAWTGAMIRRGPRAPAAWPRSLALVVVALFAALLASIPLLPGIAGYVFAPNSTSGGLSLQFLHELLIDVFTLFAAGTGLPAVLTVGLFSLGVGVALYRRQWFGGVAFTWIMLPILLLWLSRPQHMFVPRYFLFMQPLYWLMIAYGVVQVGPPMSAALPRPFGGHRTRYLVPGLLSAALLAVTLPPTWYSYHVEKTTDWSALCAYLHRNLQPGDAVSGNVWSMGALTTYCLNPQFFPNPPRDIAFTPDGTWPIAQFTHSGRNVWFIYIPAGTVADLPYIQRHYTQIASAAWGQPGFIPANAYGTQFIYPQSEPPAVLYHHVMRHPPHLVQLHDNPGRAVSPTWPDYSAIPSGGSYDLHLGLPVRAPRVLRISYFAGLQYEVVVNGRLLARFSGGANAGQWDTITIPLPATVGSDFLVQIQHDGPGTAAISRVEVGYR